MRTCPITVDNKEDNSLLKNDFLRVFKVQWPYFTGEVNESKTACVKILPHFVYQKVIKLVHF